MTEHMTIMFKFDNTLFIPSEFTVAQWDVQSEFIIFPPKLLLI